MDRTEWETVQESDLRRFLRGARPDWRASELAAAENKLRRIGITDTEDLSEALRSERHDLESVVLNSMFEMEELVPFDEETLEALIQQAARPLPKARTVVQTRDPAAERSKAPVAASPFSRFFEDDGDDAKPKEKLTIAEQRSRHMPRRAPREENAQTLREKRLAACRKMGAEMARAEIENSWREPELAEEDQSFEVVHSMVVIKEAPNEAAPDLGVMRRGEFIQVKPRRVEDKNGREWVELTFLELLRSCSSSKGTVTEGFVLMDATHLGIGPLLRGPVSRKEQGQEDEGTEPPAESAGPAEDVEARAEAEEVVEPVTTEPVPPAPTATPTPGPAPPEVKAAAAPEQAPPAPVEASIKAPTPKPKPKAGSGKAPKLLPHAFKVLQPAGAAVREGPSTADIQISTVPASEVVELEEETFDGWAKLAGADGWVCRRAVVGGELLTYLEPVGKQPLMATTELLTEPGPRTFEVIFRPRVAVKVAPRPTSKLVGNAEFGDLVLGMSQTYDGWIRLVRNEGWVCGIGTASGQMLR